MKKVRTPRVRVFAGPNGSGKTTLSEKLASRIPLYHVVNPDYLLQQMIAEGGLDLGEFEIRSTTSDFRGFVEKSTYGPGVKRSLRSVKVMGGRLDLSGAHLDSYAVALIGAYLRDAMVRRNVSFSFETVFSHHSKIDELARAVTAGYRVYLYFIATEQADINVSRVTQRALKGGHGVPAEKVRSRYVASIENLLPAVRLAYRAYIFDNSGGEAEWIAEILPSGDLVLKTETVPLWFRRSVLGRLER